MSDPRAPDPARSKEPGPVLWLGLVFFLTFLVYVPALQNEFAWDDKQAAKAMEPRGRNTNVAELHPIPYYYTTGYWPNKDPGSPNYRPLTVLSFGLGHALFGERADVAHLLTLLAHLLAVWLTYLLLRSLGVPWVGATLGTLVFGVHAIHSEAVASIVGRAESLAFACGAAALLAVRAAAGRSRLGQLGLLAAAGAALFAACSFKESGIAWAAFAPLSLWLCRMPGRSFDGVGWLVLGAAMLVPTAVFVWLRHSFLAGVPETGMGYLENPHQFTSATIRVLSSLVVWGYALLVTLVPFRLGVDHGPTQFPLVTGFDDPWAVVAIFVAVAFVALLVLAFRWRGRHPLFAMAVACFFGFSFLVSNIAFPIYVVFAERTYYTPSLALSLALCALYRWLRERASAPAGEKLGPHPAWTVALGIWVGFSAHKAFERNGVFADDLTLVEREVLEHPRSLRMQVVAGAIHHQRKEYKSAQRRFEAAVRLDAQEPRGWIGLTKALVHQGLHGQAAQSIGRGLQVPVYRHRPGMQQEMWILAAKVYVLVGDRESACVILEKSAAADPAWLRGHPDLLGALRAIVGNAERPAALRDRAGALLGLATPGR